MKWLSSYSIRTKLLAFAAISASLVFASAAFGLFKSEQSLLMFEELVQQDMQAERSIRIMTADFKKQVQEWKNVLIRGHDAKKLDKYWGKFQKQEKSIQTVGAELLGNIGHLPEARRKLDTFLSEHERMGVAYRRGLVEFKGSGFVHTVGDTAVSGIDRAPT